VIPDISRDKADHASCTIGFKTNHVGESEHANQIQQRPGILWEADFFKMSELVQVAPAGLLDRYGLRSYFSNPLIKLPSRLLNSIGKINFVAGEVPMAFNVSKYCKVMVFWSTVCALA
jgi:hypothetical protein